MPRPKRKRLLPKNIKFNEAQVAFLEKKAAASFHGNVSAVIKDYVDRDMQFSNGK